MENFDRASSRRHGAKSKSQSSLLRLLPSRRSLTTCLAPNLSRARTGKLKASALEESLEGALALDVSYVSYNAGLATPGAAPRGLAVSLGAAGPSLRHLDLSQMARRDAAGQESFGKALVSSLQRCPSLRTLKLAGNGLRDSGLELLLSALCPSGEATAPSLEELDLSWNRLGNGNLVARLLADCGKRLRSLNLEANEFGDVAVVALCAGLAMNLQVQSLNLARNRFGNDGLVALANALRHQQSSSIEEAPEEIPSLPSRTSSRPSLARWLVGVQCALEQGGAQHAPGPCLGLRQLDLSGTRVADVGAAALAEALKAGGGAGSLALLALQGTAIGSRGRAALEEAVRGRQAEVEDFAQAAGAAISGQGPAPEGRMPRLLVVQGLGLEALGAELAARSEAWLESLDAAMTAAAPSCPGSPSWRDGATPRLGERVGKKPSLEALDVLGVDDKTASSPDALGRFGMADATDSEPAFDEPESEASMAPPAPAPAPEAPADEALEALEAEAALTAEALAEMEKQEGEANICRSQTERTEEVEELRARRIVQQQRGRLEEGTFFMSPASSPEPEQEVDCGASASGTPAWAPRAAGGSPAGVFCEPRVGSKMCCEHLEDAIRCASGGGLPLLALPAVAADGAAAEGEAADALQSRGVLEAAEASGASAAPRLTLPGPQDWSAVPASWAAAQMLAQEGSARRRLKVRSATDPGLETEFEASLSSGSRRPPPLPADRLAVGASPLGQLAMQAAGLAQLRAESAGSLSAPAAAPRPAAEAPLRPGSVSRGQPPGPPPLPKAGKAKGKGPPGPPPPPRAEAGKAKGKGPPGPPPPPRAEAGKAKGKGPPGPPPPPRREAEEGPVGEQGAGPSGKAKGKGKAPPPPPPQSKAGGQEAAPAGKAKGKGKGPPPPPPKGAGAAPPTEAAGGEASEGGAAKGAKGKGKAKGKGGPPPPPAAGQEAAAPQGGKGGPPAPKGKGKGKNASGGAAPDAKAAQHRFRAATVSLTGPGSAPFHRKIYWKPLELQCMEGTIFEEGPSSSASSRIDTGALQRMFEGESAKLAAAAARSSSLLKSVQGKAEGTKVLSDNRARNIAIILKRLPTSTNVLSRILCNLEWENELLRTDQLEQILDAIPTKEEAEQLAPHAAPEALAKLRDVEQMVMPLTEIRRGSARVKLICCARNLSAQAEAATAPLETLRAACAAIHSSQTLREVMMSAIEIGNYINTGDSNMGAKAIAIGSLLQLRDFKMGRMSSLHFLCAQLRLQREDASEALQRELRPVTEAAKYQVQGISQGVRAFDADANTVAAECKNFAQEYDAGGGGPEAGEAAEGDAMKIRGSARSRLEQLSALVEGLSKQLHADVETTASQVKDTLRFCGVRAGKGPDVPADFEPFLAQLAEFVRAFRQHWGEVNADLPRYSAFFTGEGAVDPAAESLQL